MSDPQLVLKRWFREKTRPHGIKVRLAETSGYTTTQISRMRNVDTDDPKKRQEIPLKMIEAAARFFNELPPGFEAMLNWLDDPPMRTPKQEDVTQVDVLSTVTAGRLAAENAVLLPDEVIRTIVVSGLGLGDWAALVVDGTSMDRIAPDGSTLIFNRIETALVNGNFYVFRDPYSGDATFKQWASGPPRLRPYSNSNEHDTIYLDNEPVVLGRARRVLIDL